jgi:hypothetical protein
MAELPARDAGSPAILPRNSDHARARLDELLPAAWAAARSKIETFPVGMLTNNRATLLRTYTRYVCRCFEV